MGSDPRRPPPGLVDPIIRRHAVNTRTWREQIKGRLPGLRDHAVALRLATYANNDGTNAHPGTSQLADNLGCDRKTIERSLAWLLLEGWTDVSSRGDFRRGHAVVYFLTVPVPIALAIGIWPDGDADYWTERPTFWPQRQPATKPAPHWRGAGS